MKKRLFAIFLTLITLVCLISLVPSAQTAQPQAQTQSGTLLAGYAKISINPSITGLPMSGYGDENSRLSTSTIIDDNGNDYTGDDGLFATCVALTDQYGRTLLYFGVDTIGADPKWSTHARKQIAETLTNAGYDVNYDDILINASHTHSAPAIVYGIKDETGAIEETANAELREKATTYRNFVYAQLSTAALNAMRDRAAVTMTKGSVDASDALKANNPTRTENQCRMSYVRHYKQSDGVVSGSNFGRTDYNTTTTTMVSDPVDTMHLVKFTYGSGVNKQPIVLVNWNVHSTVNSTTMTEYGRNNYYNISADYVGSLRYQLELNNCRPAFMQGAAGNVVPTTPVEHLQNPDTISGNLGTVGYLYGNKLAEIAIYGLNHSMSDPLDTSAIRHMSKEFRYDGNAPTEKEGQLVKDMLAYTGNTYGYSDLIAYLTANATNWSEHTQYETQFPYLKQINSRHQLKAASLRKYWIDNPTAIVYEQFDSIGAVMIGTELSFVVGGGELSDRYFDDETGSTTDNDWNKLIDSTYGTPLVMGYTNHAFGYVPNAKAYTYNAGSTEYAVGSYESQTSWFAKGAGEALIDLYDTLLNEIQESRVQCECGGVLADGTNGHTCDYYEFHPWTDSATLPHSGNYYLDTDVVVSEQWWATGELRLDLNGKTITHNVTQTADTRVFTTYMDTYIAITDTVGGGKITRNLSSLSPEAKAAITNYGLIFSLYDTYEDSDKKTQPCHSSMTLYGGILDATRQQSGGGCCVATFNNNDTGTATFRMYGGTLMGGYADDGSCIYSQDSVELYGGTVTGGIDTNTHGGAIYIAGTGKLLLSGNANVTGNYKADDRTPANITVSPDSFTVAGTYSGTAGLNTKLVDGAIVGKSDNAVITGSITGDKNTDKAYVRVAGSNLRVAIDTSVVSINNNGVTTQYSTLAAAIQAYPGGDAVIKLLADNKEDVTFDQATKLDLAGFNLAGDITVAVSLQVMDSATDDLTIDDAQGYGKIPSNLSNVTYMDGYVMIPESDGISFHRLVIGLAGVSIRPNDVGMYYHGQFGGDEVIRDHVVAYGVGLGAGREPDFSDKTYTRFEPNPEDPWICGMDEDDRPKNALKSGLLQGIMSEKNSYSTNRKNANTQVYCQPYIDLQIGTESKRFEGKCVNLSFKELLQGTEGFNGVDQRFSTLSDANKRDIMTLYETYKNNMSSWKVPNIKQAYADLNNAS